MTGAEGERVPSVQPLERASQQELQDRLPRDGSNSAPVTAQFPFAHPGGRQAVQEFGEALEYDQRLIFEPTGLAMVDGDPRLRDAVDLLTDEKLGQDQGLWVRSLDVGVVVPNLFRDGVLDPFLTAKNVGPEGDEGIFILSDQSAPISDPSSLWGSISEI